MRRVLTSLLTQLLMLLVIAAIGWAVANRIINTYLGIPGYLYYVDVLAVYYVLLITVDMVRYLSTKGHYSDE